MWGQSLNYLTDTSAGLERGELSHLDGVVAMDCGLWRVFRVFIGAWALGRSHCDVLYLPAMPQAFAERPHPISHPTISMPHPIVEISELTQVIADNLLLDGKRGLVSLACTCRALEEQALSTLWSEQPSLRTLVKSTLPPEILSDDQPPPQVRSVHRFLCSSVFLMCVSSRRMLSGTSSDDMDPGCVSSTWIGNPRSRRRPSV